MSHREYRTRIAWLEAEWNQPSRSDFYLMRIAQQVLLSTPQEGGKTSQLLDFKIPFDDPKLKSKKPKESGFFQSMMNMFGLKRE